MVAPHYKSTSTPKQVGLATLRKALATLIAVLAHLAGFALLYPLLGIRVAALAILPIFTISWLWGMRCGVLAVFLSVPIHLLLMGEDGRQQGLIQGLQHPGNFILLLEAIVVGRWQRLTLRIRQELLERKHAESLLQKQVEELAVLQASMMELNSRHDLGLLLQTILEHAIRLLKGTGGELFLCDAEREELRFVTGVGIPDQMQERRLRYGEGAAGRVAQTRRPLLIHNYSQWPGRVSFYEPLQPRQALVGAPLIWEGKVMGVIHVLHEEPGHFIQSDLDLLALFANHAAVALETARLLDAEREHRRQVEQYATDLAERERFLSGLNAMTQAVLRTDDFSRLIQLLADSLGELFEADACFIALWDEAEQRTLPTAAFGDQRDTYRAIKIEPGATTLTQSVLQERRPLAVEDPESSPYVSASVLAHFPCRALLALPLAVGEQKIGSAVVAYEAPRRFTEADLLQGEQVAGQISLALTNARNLEAERQRRVAAAILVEIAHLAGSSLEMKEMLRQVTRRTAAVCEAQRCNILLLGEARKYFHLIMSQLADGQESVELWESFLSKGRLEVEAVPLFQEVVQTREPLIISAATPLLGALAAWVEFFAIRTCLAVPLINKDQVIGLMILDRTDDAQPFTPNQTALAMTIAGQVAAHIENARLYGEMQQLAVTDPLTGLYNRRGFVRWAEHELEHTRRFGRAISLVMFDIDRFKLVNDSYGHPVGDEVMKELAMRLLPTLRSIDLLCRYGGKSLPSFCPKLIPRRLRSSPSGFVSWSPINPSTAPTCPCPSPSAWGLPRWWGTRQDWTPCSSAPTRRCTARNREGATRCASGNRDEGSSTLLVQPIP